MLDAVNMAATVAPNKTVTETNIPITREPNLADKGLSQAGQTSEIGPPVVANISTATLETSRAVNAPEQLAEQTAPTSIVEAEAKGQNTAKNDTAAASRAGRNIDRMV